MQDILKNVVGNLFNHGHPGFNGFMIEQMRLHSEKNHGYAGGGAPLGNFDRVAAIMKLYPKFELATPQGVAMMYYLKHFDNVMWALNNARKPSDESLADMAVYATLLRCMGVNV